MTGDITRELTERLKEQRIRYTQAVAAADQLLADLERQTDPTAPLEAMRRSLDLIGRGDERLRLLRQTWDQQGRPRSAELQQGLAELESTLVDLIGKVSRAEAKASEAKQRLQPELAEATRRGQMLRAYLGH